MADAVQSVHAESVRMGIRLAAMQYTGKRLPEDGVAKILAIMPPSFRLEEFPLAVLTEVHKNKAKLRRESAQRILECMLHHAGDPAMLTNEDLEKIGGKAWRLAMAMEEQEQGQSVLDQLQPGET